MMLSRNPWTRIRHGNFHTVWPRETKSPRLFHWGDRRHAALPKVRPCFQRHTPARGRMFQRIVQKIRCCLLYLLVVESERRNRWIETRFQLDAFSLKSLGPAFR